jgi:hypothetical protein
MNKPRSKGVVDLPFVHFMDILLNQAVPAAYSLRSQG